MAAKQHDEYILEQASLEWDKQVENTTALREFDGLSERNYERNF